MKNLRQKLFVIFILVLMLIEMIDDNNYKVKASSPERIERLSFTKIDDFNTVMVYHDKESGIETICSITYNHVYGGNAVSISCLPTGRNWK